MSPSVIFDQPAGGLFIMRVAGNTPTPEVIASFDYAVAELGVELVVVLGHTSCGAVAAACAGASDRYLKPLTSMIRSLIDDDDCPDAEHLAEQNVWATVTALAEAASPVGDAIRSGTVTVEAAIYDLATDDVRTLHTATTKPMADSKELAQP